MCNQLGKRCILRFVFRTFEVILGGSRQELKCCGIKCLLCTALGKVTLWKSFSPHPFDGIFEWKTVAWGKEFLQKLSSLQFEQWFHRFVPTVKTPAGKPSASKKLDLERKTWMPRWVGNIGKHNAQAFISWHTRVHRGLWEWFHFTSERNQSDKSFCKVQAITVRISSFLSATISRRSWASSSPYHLE